MLGKKGIVNERCLPYDAPSKPAGANLCQYQCQEKDGDQGAGDFMFVQ